MRYVGLDVHRKTVRACVVNVSGKRLMGGDVACTREAIEEFAARDLRPDDQVALEATTNTWAVVDILRPFVGKITVSNPMRTRAIAEAKVKTDKVDAEVLAQLLRCDYLPAVWEPDAQTRQLRKITSLRATLVSDRVRAKNRIRSVLGQLLIHPPMSVVFSKAGVAWLKKLDLPEDERLIVDAQLRLLESIEAELSQLDPVLCKLAHEEERVKLLMTLPGVSYETALTLLGALGDVSRFRDGDHAASYLGLTPSTHQSARRCYHGPITKAGSSQARWMLTQGVQHVGKHPGPLGAFFRRIARRKGRNIAVVATARKLVTIAFLMLKNNEPYRYALPHVVDDKLAHVRFSATGERRKPERSPRPKTEKAKSRPQRCVRALPDIYSYEGMPPARNLEQVSAGERRIIRRAGSTRFVRQINCRTVL